MLLSLTSVFIHLLQCSMIHFFLLLSRLDLWMYHNLSILLVDSCFQIVSIVTKAAMNILVKCFFCRHIFSFLWVNS